MVVLLVIITVAACILADYLLSHRQSEVAEKEVRVRADVERRKVTSAGVQVQEGVAYHPGHTWMAVESEDRVRVGMDDLARRLVGPDSEVVLPAVGQSVRQGMPIWSVERNGRRVAMLSPVDGVIEEIHPRLATKAPMGGADSGTDAWIARVKVAELGRDMKNLLHGHLAERWLEDSESKLRRRFDEDLGPLLNDGGTLGVDIHAVLNDDEWVATCRELFLSDPTD